MTVSNSSNDIYDVTTAQGMALCDAVKQKVQNQYMFVMCSDKSAQHVV